MLIPKNLQYIESYFNFPYHEKKIDKIFRQGI